MAKVDISKEQAEMIQEALYLLRDKLNDGSYPADEFDYFRNLYHSTLDVISTATGDISDFMLGKEPTSYPWEGTMVQEEVDFINACRADFKSKFTEFSDKRIEAEKEYREYLKKHGHDEKEIFRIIWDAETKSADI